MVSSLGIIFVAVFAGVSATINKDDAITYSAVLSSNGRSVELRSGNASNAIAWAIFSDQIFQNGWAFLEIGSNTAFDDELQAYAAGALEGFLTKDLMEKQFNNMYKNYCVNQHIYCDKLMAFMNENIQYIVESAKQNKHISPYWYQVHLQMKQLLGLSNSFENETLDPRQYYSNFTRVMFFNAEGDLMDLEGALQRPKNKFSLNQIGRCSSLVKAVPGDIYFSHVSWFTYKAMLRIQKKYVLPFHITELSEDIVPGHTVVMSSYPGKLLSLDDFYLLSSGLAVTETTNDNFNNSLWKYITPKSVPTWLRSVAANRLAESGAEWYKFFRKHNSGTYNNQWIIFDYKRYDKRNNRITAGALWIIEQMPTIMIARDKTETLVRTSFWSSFNIPVFPEIYQLSGTADMAKKYGDFYSHDNCPRGKIFRRDHTKVVDADSMINLMRYNDYEHDAASRCNCTPLPYNPTAAISSRYDLVDNNNHYDLPNLKRKSSGAIDCKFTNVDRFWDMEFIGINGPTNVQQPTFQWSKSGFNDIPEGHPDVWNFPSVQHKWIL